MGISIYAAASAYKERSLALLYTVSFPALLVTLLRPAVPLMMTCAGTPWGGPCPGQKGRGHPTPQAPSCDLTRDGGHSCVLGVTKPEVTHACCRGSQAPGVTAIVATGNSCQLAAGGHTAVAPQVPKTHIPARHINVPAIRKTTYTIYIHSRHF
jgi:hypothetical protein